MSQLTVLLGGRAAEEIVIGSDTISTGASSDLQRVYSLARRMITEWGYGESVHAFPETNYLGEETVDNIDRQIEEFIDKANAHAKKIIT